MPRVPRPPVVPPAPPAPPAPEQVSTAQSAADYVRRNERALQSASERLLAAYTASIAGRNSSGIEEILIPNSELREVRPVPPGYMARYDYDRAIWIDIQDEARAIRWASSNPESQYRAYLVDANFSAAQPTQGTNAMPTETSGGSAGTDMLSGDDAVRAALLEERDETDDGNEDIEYHTLSFIIGYMTLAGSVRKTPKIMSYTTLREFQTMMKHIERRKVSSTILMPMLVDKEWLKKHGGIASDHPGWQSGSAIAVQALVPASFGRGADQRNSFRILSGPNGCRPFIDEAAPASTLIHQSLYKTVRAAAIKEKSVSYLCNVGRAIRKAAREWPFAALPMISEGRLEAMDIFAKLGRIKDQYGAETQKIFMRQMMRLIAPVGAWNSAISLVCVAGNNVFIPEGWTTPLIGVGPIPIWTQDQFYRSSQDGRLYRSERDAPEYRMRHGTHDKLYNYSTNVLDYLKVIGTKQEALTPSTCFLGVELEVEAKEDRKAALDIFYKKTGDMVGICKRDSSLKDGYGFEICSRPGTLRWHQTAWNEYLKVAHKTVKGWSGYQCGIHVHISKAAFASPLHIAKFIGFIHSDVNKPFIEKIAGRSSQQYTKIYHKKISEEAKAQAVSHTGRDKYDAVNQLHAKTLEVRIFRSNVNLRGFLKNLEFVHALWSFTASAPASQCLRDPFCEWVKGYTSVYPNLARWLEQAGLIAFNYNRTEGEVACA